MTRQRAEGHFGILAEMNWRQRDEGLCGPVWLEGGSLGCQEQELLQGACGDIQHKRREEHYMVGAQLL